MDNKEYLGDKVTKTEEGYVFVDGRLLRDVCIMFDGVIHPYSKGNQENTIYDPINVDAMNFIQSLLNNEEVYYRVVIHAVRNCHQVKEYIEAYIQLAQLKNPNFLKNELKVVHPSRIKYTERDKIIITWKSPLCDYYIGYNHFNYSGSFEGMAEKLRTFKHWYNK